MHPRVLLEGCTCSACEEPALEYIQLRSPFPRFGFCHCGRQECKEFVNGLVSVSVVPLEELVLMYPEMMAHVGTGNMMRILDYDAYSTTSGVTMSVLCMDLVTLKTSSYQLNRLQRFTPPAFRMFSAVSTSLQLDPCDLCGEKKGGKRKVIRTRGCEETALVCCAPCARQGRYTACLLTHTHLNEALPPVWHEGHRWSPCSGKVVVNVANVGLVAVYFKEGCGMRLEVMAFSVTLVPAETDHYQDHCERMMDLRDMIESGTEEWFSVGPR